MAYADLTPEDKDTLQYWLNLVRGWSAAQGKLNNQGVAIDTYYQANIQAVLAKFNTNETVPNSSGLAGSLGLNVGADAVTIQSHIEGILSGFNTSGHRQLWAKAAGIGNLV